MRLKRRWGYGLLILGVGAGVLPGAVEERTGLGSALQTLPGTVKVDSRLRYEQFDQAGGLDMEGLSHRIRYGFLTDEVAGIRLMAEGETVYAWGHGRDLHPADNAGDGTDLNQLWVSFRGEDSLSVKIGRQIYTLDDHRFIGHVGWRQNIQTFDAVTGDISLSESLGLKAFYIDAVNAVTGGHNEIEAWGLNVAGKVGKEYSLTGFLYSIDGRPDMPAGSGNTAGIRFSGTFKGEAVIYVYSASYARQWEQSGTGGKPFGHDYWMLDARVKRAEWSLGFGFESLGGNGIHGFSTPLATLHKFNGYADVFLGATATGGLVNGLEDYFLLAEYVLPAGNGIRLTAIHHWFRPKRGPGDYGNEVDLVASFKVSNNWSLMGKYGRYSSRGGSGGVGGRDKEMLTLEVNFIY
jgi:hypothetical protein